MLFRRGAAIRPPYFLAVKENKLEKIPITPKGYETLKKEMSHLISVERPRVIKAIEEARAHGDLSENAEFKRPRNGRPLLKLG